MFRILLVASFIVFSIHGFSQTNYSLLFNGTSTTVAIGQPIPTNSSYTKEAWVYLTNATGNRNIISALNAPLWVNDGYLMAGHNGVYDHVADAAAFPLNRWVHTAVTYDQGLGVMKLYKDGVEVSSRVGMPAFTAVNTFIGSHNGSQNYFVGNIDEVRIWNVALSASQIKSRMHSGPNVASTGLRAYYKFNEGTGSTLTNTATGFGGSNGSIANGSWAASPINFGANAVTFDGVNDYISLGNSRTLKIATNLTYEMWIHSAQWVSSAQRQISSCYESGGYGFTLAGGTLNFYLMPSGTSTYVGVSIPTSTLTNNTWYHVAGTFDGQNIRMYLNGVLAGTNTLSTNRTIRYDYPDNHLLLAAEATSAGGTNGDYFPGSIDEVRLWNVVRTASQIYGNMNRELDPSNASAVNGLVAYYTFNQGVANGTNTNHTVVTDQQGTFNGTMINFAMSGTSSNYTTQRPGLEVLPVKWDKFTVQNTTAGALLQWNTLEETNTKSFDVQHSTDGRTWASIGSVRAAGESTTERNYEFLHTSPVTGVNYYRLAQSDLDNSILYSPVVTLSIRASVASVTLLNNLVTDGKLRVNALKPEVVSLYTTDGRLLLRKRLSAGMQVISASDLRPGTYLLESNGFSNKFVVQ